MRVFFVLSFCVVAIAADGGANSQANAQATSSSAVNVNLYQYPGGQFGGGGYGQPVGGGYGPYQQQQFGGGYPGGYGGGPGGFGGGPGGFGGGFGGRHHHHGYRG
ncbi:PREDICTED: WW domain-containing protein C660.06-like [Rhagoletis zephyria]|uniref:WW domain-containing protein C660.06-like n=1 Tax=Rhagoletis zephyria TaxID=28612 RepID=UPI00081120CD|nr:PREDICTED: WW domain-containing protein C660.06-like [Rhagoletis zephyria]